VLFFTIAAGAWAAPVQDGQPTTRAGLRQALARSAADTGATTTAPGDLNTAASGGGSGLGAGSNNGNNGNGSGSAKTPRRQLFPDARIIGLYGLPGGFGAIGRLGLAEARREIARQTARYEGRGAEPISAFNVVATVAHPCSRSLKDKCRSRLPGSTLRKYLAEIRKVDGRMILDIQPGRANPMAEFKYWRRTLLREPDVDLAIDPEWNWPKKAKKTGGMKGRITAPQINKIAKKMQRFNKKKNLPPKVLMIHQFHKGSVRKRSKLKNNRSRVRVMLNFDGIGTPSAKKAVYGQLATKKAFNGFSLFYKLDSKLMSPAAVGNLKPPAYYVMYQ